MHHPLSLKMYNKLHHAWLTNRIFFYLLIEFIVLFKYTPDFTLILNLICILQVSSIETSGPVPFT